MLSKKIKEYEKNIKNQNLNDDEKKKLMNAERDKISNEYVQQSDVFSLGCVFYAM